MNERERSYLAFGLAALAIVCATVLAGLRVIDAKDWAIAVAGAFAAVGLYHAPSPFRGGAAPVALFLALCGLGGCQAQVEVGYHDRPLARPAAGADPLAVGLNGDFVRLATLGSAPTELSGKPGLYAGADGVLRLKAAGGATLKAGESTGPTVSAGAPGGAALGSCWADSTDDYRVYCRESSGDLAQRVDLTAPGIIGGGTPSSATFTTIAMASSGKITGLGTPTQSADAATKAYVDSTAGGAVTFSSVKSALGAADSSIGVNGQKITGLAQGTASGQALHAGRSVSTTSGQLTGGGALTSDLTLGLATAGTAGTYAWPSSVTTDAYGRVTAVTGQSSVAQNCIVAGPAAGGSGALSCRSAVIADLPASGVTAGTYASPSSVVVNAAGQVTSITAGGGGGGGPFWIYDPALVGQAVSGPISGGDFTVGWLFAVYSTRQITGGKVWWPGGAATLVLKLYDNGGSELKTKTETVSGSGVVDFTFASAFTPTPGSLYRVGVYDGGTSFPGAIGSATDSNAPNAAVRNGEWMLITPTYATGGAAPLIDATWTYPYPLRPKFSGEQ